MRRTILSAILLTICAAATAAVLPTGEPLQAGHTYYLYNVGEQKYLSSHNGTLTLGGERLAVTVSETADATTAVGYYTLSSAEGDLSYMLNATTLASDGVGKHAQWRLLGDTSPSGPATGGAYILALRVKELNTALSLYATGGQVGVSRTSLSHIKAGHWLLVDQSVEESVCFRETDKTYEEPHTGVFTAELTRTLAPKAWNSFCSPFAISQTEILATFGSGTQVAAFTGFSATQLHFTTVTSGMEAGEPYLIFPTEVRADNTYTFTTRTAFAHAAAAKTVTHDDGESVTLHASFVPVTVPSRAYVFGGGNTLYHLTSAMPMNGFRTYFTHDESSEGKFASWTLDETTAITPPTIATEPFDVYSLSGQLIRRAATTMSHLPAGVYVVNGEKRVVTKP